MIVLRTFFLVAILTTFLVGPQSPTALNSGPTAAMTTRSSATPDGKGSASQSATDAREDTRKADQILGELRTKYRYLDGVTVMIGVTPRDEQAVAYYTTGVIVISRTHTVSIDRILAHEIWHIIDWRDNGHLDWQENLPPSNTSVYVNK
jgi:hypothetical protein